MKFLNLVLWALPATLVAAEGDVRTTTHTPRTTRSKECVGAVYHTLRGVPSVKSFCSSFLRTTAPMTVTLPTITSTVRTTQSKSTSTVTITRTRTSVVYVRSTPYTTVTTTSFANDAVACASSAGFFSGKVVGPAGDLKSDIHNDVDKRTIASTPSAFSGKPSASISSMCSCLHAFPRTKTRGRNTIGQSTVTVTKTIVPAGRAFTTTVRTTAVVTTTLTNTAQTQTKTATYVEPVPTTFNGLRWYAYPNSYDFTGTPFIDIPIFNSPNYEDNGMVQNPPNVNGGAASAGQCTLPGSSKTLNCAQLTVVMQGYLYAPEEGTYTLTTGGSDASHVDNYVGLWTGNDAYNNYNNNNADFIAIREDHSTVQQGGSFSYQLAKGELLPVTIIYMNGGYAGAFQFQIIEPNGNVNSDTSNFWIPACADSNLFSP